MYCLNKLDNLGLNIVDKGTLVRVIKKEYDSSIYTGKWISIPYHDGLNVNNSFVYCHATVSYANMNAVSNISYDRLNVSINLIGSPVRTYFQIYFLFFKYNKSDIMD